jgi:hypothetical protein
MMRKEKDVSSCKTYIVLTEADKFVFTFLLKKGFAKQPNVFLSITLQIRGSLCKALTSHAFSYQSSAYL